MGDVIIFLLSKTQNSKRDKEKEGKERRGLKKKVEVEEKGNLLGRCCGGGVRCCQRDQRFR